MKRFMIYLVVAGLIVAAGLAFTFQYASAQQPNPGTPNGWQGRGGMMGGGMHGAMMGGNTAGYGAMHNYMQETIAAKLGITVEELNQAHADGKTFWQIAEEKGYNAEEAQQLMLDARGEALDQAVEAGAITSEQAEWMKQRMTNMTPGNCHGSNGAGFARGMMGRGWRGNQ